LFREPSSGSSSISLEECEQQCSSTDGCHYFTHGHGHRANRDGNFVCMGCPLSASLQGHSGYTTYRSVIHNMKCPHNHEDRLFRSSDVTLEECEQQCSTTAGCNYFSHGSFQGSFVCMGCTQTTNLQGHNGFSTYRNVR
jgi:hypothetical protein